MTFTIAFAVLYTICTEFNLPLLTYHPVIGQVDFLRTPERRGPAMYWYGWMLTSLIGATVVAAIAGMIRESWLQRAIAFGAIVAIGYLSSTRSRCSSTIGRPSSWNSSSRAGTRRSRRWLLPLSSATCCLQNGTSAFGPVGSPPSPSGRWPSWPTTSARTLRDNVASTRRRNRGDRMTFLRPPARRVIALVAPSRAACPSPHGPAGSGFDDDDDNSAEEGPSYFGFVRDSGGATIPDAKVTVSLKNRVDLVTRTDALGTYKAPGFGAQNDPTTSRFPAPRPATSRSGWCGAPRRTRMRRFRSNRMHPAAQLATGPIHPAGHFTERLHA